MSRDDWASVPVESVLTIPAGCEAAIQDVHPGTASASWPRDSSRGSQEQKPVVGCGNAPHFDGL